MPVRFGGAGAYLDGRFAIAEGDAEQAAQSFARALEDDPANPDLIDQAFLAALLAGSPDAVTLAKKLGSNQPATLLLAGAEVKAGHWAEAEAKFRTLQRQGLGDILQPIVIAWAQAGGGHAEAALATLKPFAEGQRLPGVYALNAAFIADLAGMNADAARYYRAAQAGYAGPNLRLQQALASWQARQGHKDLAEQTLRVLSNGADEMSIAMPAMIAHDTERTVPNAAAGIAETYLMLAGTLQQEGSQTLAHMLARLALELRPDFAPARLMLADLNGGAGNEDIALALLAPVRNSDPLSGAVRLRRALLLEKSHQTDRAQELLRALAEDYPESSLPDFQLGDLLRNLKQYPAAIAAYDQAITRQGADPVRGAWPLFYARGIAHERNKEWPLAEADFKRALQLAPDQPMVVNYLAYSWADQGIHLDEAAAMLSKAVAARPNDGAVIDSLGWVNFREGHIDAALSLLEQAVGMESEDATINGHFGDALWAAGRHLEAIYQWRRALTLNPEPEDQAHFEQMLRDHPIETLPAPAADHAAN
jgi:tetratricopeptide (TPR) repeat protein